MLISFMLTGSDKQYKGQLVERQGEIWLDLNVLFGSHLRHDCVQHANQITVTESSLHSFLTASADIHWQSELGTVKFKFKRDKLCKIL